MNAKVKAPESIRASIGCPCHRPNKCTGALQFIFPVRIFEGAGELEYRQIRQASVGNFLKVFDEYYEQARHAVMERDPHLIRPKRGGGAVMIVDATDVTQQKDEENDNAHEH